MPGSIHVSAAQPSAGTAPLFLQVALGKREYSGSIGQGEFSFPVTSLRESMVMLLYNTDKSLISQAELKTKAVVESGTMDVVFSLDNGGSIILRLQFLLSDEDRKRVQEMRNSAVKRKQQELLSDGYGLSQDIPSEGCQPTLRKSMSLDDLQEKAVLSANTADSQMEDARDSLMQSELSSAVKKMISALESSSPQVLTRIKSESSLKGPSTSSENSTQYSSDKSSSSVAAQQVSGHTEAGTSGKAQLLCDDKISSSRPGKQILLSNKRSNASGQQATSEGRIRRLFREKDMDNSETVMITRQNRSKKRSTPKRRRAIGPYWLEHIHPHVCITTASRQLRELVELEPPLDSFLLIGQFDTKKPNLKVVSMQDQGTCEDKSKNSMVSARGGHGFPVLDGWLINQGVRVVIVIIACGAIFLNNR
ncbi:uncharacterized protein LOC102706101 [Oryza brachyantha]|uniref:Uncharacterized protein n=1 Tax=Oryza brachyantha TaxID=4533 RepID=J3M543_ORYBR|nr:uncharacterized protein LOC102706101 [Oryza brachyantha]